MNIAVGRITLHSTGFGMIRMRVTLRIQTPNTPKPVRASCPPSATPTPSTTSAPSPSLPDSRISLDAAFARSIAMPTSLHSLYFSGKFSGIILGHLSASACECVYTALMSKIWVECWQCDECGHVWIKSWDGKIPEQCASSKCRKRSWNKNQLFVPADPTSAEDVNAAQEASRIARAICSGKIDPKTVAPELTAAGLEAAGVEPAPTCAACEESMVEGGGKSAGRWACQDVSCPKYGLEVKR